jgi:hypothetical protein
VNTLYGLKTSALAWRSNLARTLRDLGYFSCIADFDVWMRPNTKPNGFLYYEYVLVYTDDILSISHDPMDDLTKLDQHYNLILVDQHSIWGHNNHYFILPDDPDRDGICLQRNMLKRRFAT